jgi:WD40 repeat protein
MFVKFWSWWHLAVLIGVIALVAPSGWWTLVIAQDKPEASKDIKPIVSIKLGVATGTRVVFTPDSKTLAAYQNGGRIRIWEAMTAKKQPDLFVGEDYWNGTIAFSPDGTLLASTHSGWYKHGMCLWDWKTKRELARVEGTYNPRGLAFSPDGKTLAFVDVQHLYFFGVEKRKITHKLANEDGAFSMPVFSPDSKKLAVTGAVGRRLQIYDCERAVEEKTIQVIKVSEQAYFQSVHWSKDGKTIIAAGPNALTFWDVGTGKKVRQIDAITKENLGGLAASPDERFVATGTVRGNIVVWDLRTSKQTMYIGSRFPAFSPDGKLLAVVYPSEIHVWDFAAFIKHSGFTEKR